MTSTQLSGRGRLAVAALLTAGLALAGCGPAKAGAAAIIDGERIPVSVIQDKVEAIAAARAAHGLEPVPADDLAREQILRMIKHQIVIRTAAGRGVTVTPGQIDKEIANVEAQNGGAEAFQALVAASNIAPGDLRTFVQDYLSVDALQSALAGAQPTDEELIAARGELAGLLSDTGRELPVRVNPRYGVWNPEGAEGAGEITLPSNPLSTPDPGSLETAPPSGP